MLHGNNISAVLSQAGARMATYHTACGKHGIHRILSSGILAYRLSNHRFYILLGTHHPRKFGNPRRDHIFLDRHHRIDRIPLVARYWFPLFPLGISFYTFQALSYLIEIYWEEEREDDFVDFTLYMMLFVKFLSTYRACVRLTATAEDRTSFRLHTCHTWSEVSGMGRVSKSRHR